MKYLEDLVKTLLEIDPEQRISFNDFKLVLEKQKRICPNFEKYILKIKQ